MRTVVSTLFIFCATLFSASECRADIYAEYDCRTTQKTSLRTGLMTVGGQDAALTYVQFVYFKKDFMAVQVVVDGIVLKEYGFDLAAGIYYEADPAKNEYRKFTIGKIKQDFASLKMSTLSESGGLNLFDAMSASGSRYVDYEMHPKKAWFGGKKVLGLKCDLYNDKVALGSAGLFSGTVQKNRQIQATDQIPSYQEYAEFARKLKAEAAFYKAKQNEISEYILAMISVPAFPAQIESKQGSVGGFAGMSKDFDATLAVVSTRPISNTSLLYYKDDIRFTTNLALEQEDADSSLQALAASASLPQKNRYDRSSGNGSARSGVASVINAIEVFYTVAIFGLFMFGLFWRWYNRDIIGNPFWVGGFDLTGYFVIIVVLFSIQMMHAFTPVPFLHSMFAETTLLIIVGGGVIWGRRFLRIAGNRAAAARGEGRLCSRCNELVEIICAVCPACKQRLR